MTTVSRKEFVSELAAKSGSIDVNNMGAPLEGTLDRAGISRTQLAKIAGDDGVISGAAEMKRLFGLVDGYDDNGSAASLRVSTDAGQATASGELHQALRDEVAARRALAHARGLDGPELRTLGSQHRLKDEELVAEARTVRARLGNDLPYGARDADQTNLGQLEQEIAARVAKRSPVKDPFAHGDGTTWAEQQTGRCMTRLEIYQHNLEHGGREIDPEIVDEAKRQERLATENRIFSDGHQGTLEEHARRHESEYAQATLQAMTANPFGAIAWGVAHALTDDPAAQLAAAQFGANAGDLLSAMALNRKAGYIEVPVAAPAAQVSRNARASLEPNHIYVIIKTDMKTGKNTIYKFGVSATGENRKGLSKRAEGQASKLNKQSPDVVYRSIIFERVPDRTTALDGERDHVTEYYAEYGSTPAGNKLPKRWPDERWEERGIKR